MCMLLCDFVFIALLTFTIYPRVLSVRFLLFGFFFFALKNFFLNNYF